MENSSTTHGNGEAGISESIAGELDALLGAAEALKGQVRGEIESALADLTTLVAELRDAADRLDERLAGIRGQVGHDQLVPQEQDTLRRARLVALNMAANGASRAETAGYLSERLGIQEREALLDSVYNSLASD
ncbi:MAG TPA: hypothetical protein VGI67_16490 [Thermoleophilaceae bacterium]|jgi:hypothetical protein